MKPSIGSLVKRWPVVSTVSPLMILGSMALVLYAYLGSPTEDPQNLVVSAIVLFAFGISALTFAAASDHFFPPEKPLTPHRRKKRRLGDLPPVNFILDRAAPEGDHGRN